MNLNIKYIVANLLAVNNHDNGDIIGVNLSNNTVISGGLF